MEDKIKCKASLMERLAGSITLKLNKKLKKEGLELQKMQLGLEIILINISKFIIIFSIALYLGLIKEVSIMMVSFACMRRVSFGLHAKDSIVCTILSVLCFILGSYCSYYVNLNNYVVILIFLVMIFLFYLYSPADTENHPLLQEKLRKKLKKQSVYLGIILMIITLAIPSYSIKFLVISGVCFQVVTILPLTYKILNRGYNNYEKYEGKIDKGK